MYRVAIRSIHLGSLRPRFVHGNASRLNPVHDERIKQILDALDAVCPLEELSEPTYRLHPLKGVLSGQWSVRVDRTRQIVFRVDGKDVIDVDLINRRQEELMGKSKDNAPYDAWSHRNPPHPGKHWFVPTT